ncbi:MAG: radical SAM protein [Spirochaetia bacterium]
MPVFGPVPSRRLGRSLGINNIPPKICTYACVYCQLGRPVKMQTKREVFFKPSQLQREIETRLAEITDPDEYPDYLTFVPDGEPLLDRGFGEELTFLKEKKLKTAVISNASLLGDPAVRNELTEADWVSVKVDSVHENIWHKINRPVRSLNFNSILEGIMEFRRKFNGTLVTETMLVKDVNDSAALIDTLTDYLSDLKPATSYISIPTRPPAENWVAPPDGETITRAYEQYTKKNIPAELLISYEGDDFTPGKDFKNDILSICSVHPMRQEAVDRLLARHGESVTALQKLVKNKLLLKLFYGDNTFYLRKLK